MDSSFISNRNIPYSLESLLFFFFFHACWKELELKKPKTIRKKGLDTCKSYWILPNVLKVAEFFLSYLLANGGQTTTGSLKPLWKNGQSQRDQKSVCTQKKPSWSHCWSCSGKGLSTERGSGLLLEQQGEENKASPTSLPSPRLGIQWNSASKKPKCTFQHCCSGVTPWKTQQTQTPVLE